MKPSLNAVASGEKGSCFGNVIVIIYLIEQPQILNVRISDFTRFNGGDFRFAATAHDGVVTSVIHQILATLPPSRKIALQASWSGMSNHPGISNLALADEESSWMTKHPVVHYAGPKDFPPFDFRTSDEGAARLAIDLLKDNGGRNGLSFEQEFDLARLRRAEMQVIVPRSDSSVGDWQSLVPNAVSPWVIVTRAGAERANGLASLDGQLLALEKGSPAAAEVARFAPKFHIGDAADSWVAMSEVTEGHASWAIRNIEFASYVIRPKYRDRLVTSPINSGVNSPIAFTIRSTNVLLLSLLEKGGTRNSPSRMGALGRKCQSTGLPESIWRAQWRHLRSD
ncbi:hypothetical protein LFL97_32995 [Burkholderia sp. JSH-S8]|nr:hypothetical protein LFL97_32995 [Burkholderia sp. JSH-S8]